MGARCTDVRANELLMVRGAVYRTPWKRARYYIVRHIHVFALGGRDRVGQPMSVALGCCTIINWLAATIWVCMCGVRGKIFHELEVVLNTLFGTVFEGNLNLDVVISSISVESK